MLLVWNIWCLYRLECLVIRRFCVILVLYILYFVSFLEYELYFIILVIKKGFGICNVYYICIIFVNFGSLCLFILSNK